MAESSGCFESGLEGRSRMEDGPKHIHTPAGQGDDGLMMAFSLAPFAIIEGAAVVVAEGAEGGLVEDTLEALVAAAGPSQETDASRLAQDGGQLKLHRQHLKPETRRRAAGMTHRSSICGLLQPFEPGGFTMRRSFFLTTALSALISLSAPAAHAGSHLQGPALDGREVALPDGLRIVGAPVGRIPELQRKD